MAQPAARRVVYFGALFRRFDMVLMPGGLPGRGNNGAEFML